MPLHCYENWQAQEGARAFGPNAMQVLTAMGIEAHSIDGQINNTSPSALARGPLASLTRIGSNGCKYATDLSVDRRPSERFTHLPAIISSLHAAGLDRGKAYTVGDCEDSATWQLTLAVLWPLTARHRRHTAGEDCAAGPKVRIPYCNIVY